MTGGANAAIVFEPSAYASDRKQVMGRHVAGASFLEGFVRHAAVDRYVGMGWRDTDGPAFRQQVGTIASTDPQLARRPIDVITSRSLREIAAVGTVSIPDPQLVRFATARRQLDQRGYSLCGITHTVSSAGSLGLICDLLTGPVQSWDALICTSQAVRKAVHRQQDHYADYLEQRLGKRPFSPVQTPVIPLGVDAGRFERLGADRAARARLRRQIGADERDTVVLFFGRLAFHAKAHPVPMYIAAQRVAARLQPGQGRLHLLQTGQFPNKTAEDAYRGGAERFCPDVAVHFVDGSDRSLADASWAAADVFISLSDNIQESFGITPVEAMAAGLPCLVSDWDGYRDTVVDGETGIRVPTWIPVPGVGAGLADAHAIENLSYDLYIGYASQMTVVDVPRVADALEALVQDPGRRRRMGEAGRRRAREVYDWSVVVRAYQELWAELAGRRGVDAEIAPPSWRARNARLTDPFDVFAGHASEALGTGARVALDPAAVELDALTLPCNTVADSALLDRDETDALLRRVLDGAGTVAECLRDIAPGRRIHAVRRLAWLAKYGILTLESGK